MKHSESNTAARSSRPLWLRLALAALFTGAVVLCAVIALQQNLHDTFGAREFNGESQALVRAVAASALEPVITEDRAELETIVQVLSRASGSITRVLIENESGQVLAQWQMEDDTPTGHLLSFEEPVILEGERFGRVLLERDASGHMQAFRRNLAHLSASVAFGIAVVVIVLLLMVHLAVVRPVERMSRRLHGAVEFRLRSQRMPRQFSNEIAALQQAVSMSLVNARSSRRRHAQLREANHRAEAANLAKTRFLSIMSHELRSPLSAIAGALKLLGSAQQDASLRELTGRAEKAATGVIALVSDIIDFASLDRESDVRMDTSFEPGPHLESVQQLFLLDAGVKNLRIEVQTASDLPPGVQGPAARIRQILIALVSNAVKFTNDGGVRLTLAAHADDSGEQYLRYTVEDTGCGISAAQQEQIFDEFRQGQEEYDRNYGGAGLGLALASRIVQRLGGRIGCASQPGSGSTFWFEIPVTAGVAPIATGVGAVTVAGTDGTRVLLVDDSDANRMVAAAMLEKMGVRVTEVDNAAAALQHIQNDLFDLVLMDLQMPGMDGWEATRRIRKLAAPHGEIPVVALSANASEDDRKRSHAAGMDGFLSKPVSPESLLAALQQPGDGKSARVEAQ